MYVQQLVVDCYSQGGKHRHFQHDAASAQMGACKSAYTDARADHKVINRYCRL